MNDSIEYLKALQVVFHQPPAVLVLEDGKVFTGRAVGASGEVVGEVVFNTAMTGYQEILTDPSYAGQLVCLTYPLIGNYGVNADDSESRRPWARGLIVRELSSRYSNWRATGGLDNYLKEHGIVAIDEVDTRALTRHLRIHGAQMGVISTVERDVTSLSDKIKKAPRLCDLDLVKEVETDFVGPPFLDTELSDFGTIETKTDSSRPPHIVAIDAGAKYNIMRNLLRRGCKVTVAPATSTTADILAQRPDGIFLSNGPGDPEQAPYLVNLVRELLERCPRLPVFGICLGLQVISLALGAKVYKLKFGHHGANHPVREESTGLISITSQNHCYAVDIRSLPADLQISHTNLNDGTIEGIEHRARPVFAIQYHPEAAPGPHDAQYLFDRFVKAVNHSSDRLDSNA